MTKYVLSIYLGLSCALNFIYGAEQNHGGLTTSRPVELACIPTATELFTFSQASGVVRNLKSTDPGKLTIALTAGVQDKAKIEAFIKDLGKQLTIQDRTKKGMNILRAAFSDISELTKETPNIKGREAPKDYFNGEEIQFALFADTRSEYQPELIKGWEEYKKQLALAEEKGREKGSSWVPIVNGIGQRIGANRGRQVAEIIGPPTVVARAEEEMIKKTAELDKYVADYMKSLTRDGKGPSIMFSTLVDGMDFSQNINTRDRRAVQWANSYLEPQQMIHFDANQTIHQNFFSKMNEASFILNKVFKTSEPGFRLAIISPQGKVLEVVDASKVSAASIASKYYKHKRLCAP